MWAFASILIRKSSADCNLLVTIEWAVENKFILNEIATFVCVVDLEQNQPEWKMYKGLVLYNNWWGVPLSTLLLILTIYPKVNKLYLSSLRHQFFLFLTIHEQFYRLLC